MSVGLRLVERVLEDEADVLAAQLAHLVGRQLEQVDALEEDLAATRSCRADPGRAASDRQRRDALAAARLAHEPERLAVAELEADVVDGVDDAIRREEVRRQVADLEQVLCLGALCLALANLRRELVRESYIDGVCLLDGSSDRSEVQAIASLELRIESVAQAVAEEREADQRQGDHDARQ